MNDRLRNKLIGLILAFVIGIVLSGIITFCLINIFSRQPEKILDISYIEILNAVNSTKEGMQIFLLSLISFLLWIAISVFKFFDLKDYHAKTYKVTPQIEIPLPVGKGQTQHGSVWWLKPKEYTNNFGVNTIDPDNPTIKELLKVADEEKMQDDNIKTLDVTPLDEELQKPLFKSGGLTIHKKDRLVFSRTKSFPFFKTRKVEDIYFINKDLHSLTIGATRSGKTRCLVLESINNIALSGENMIVSDPKRRTF